MIYGLTGGSGSGKTTVANFLKEMGYTVVDADKIARSLTEPGHPVLERLADTFGREILAEDGTLIRKKLGSIVFNDKEKLATLNDIMGPSMDEEFLRQIQAAREERLYGKAFFDAPTLYETGREVMVDKVWVVAAGLETRIKRIMDRDGITREQALERMKNQLPEEEKIRRADVVIYNEGTLEDLRNAVIEALKK